MLALGWASTARALDIKPGTYYFDNSKLKFSQVKMVVGSYSRDFTQVFDMDTEGNLMRVIKEGNIGTLVTP